MGSYSSPISDFDNSFLFSAGSVMSVIAVVSFVVAVVSILVMGEGDENVLRLVTGLLFGLVLCLGSRVTNVLTVVGNIEVDVALTSME